MDQTKSLQSKIKKLFLLNWASQVEFAKVSGINKATVNEYFSKNKNITTKNFVKILGALGIDLHDIVDKELKRLVGDVSVDEGKESADIATLLNGLEKQQRKELLSRAINLNKMRKNNRMIEVIERVEKRLLQ